MRRKAYLGYIVGVVHVLICVVLTFLGVEGHAYIGLTFVAFVGVVYVLQRLEDE